jgi:hypothetical protein
MTSVERVAQKHVELGGFGTYQEEKVNTLADPPLHYHEI